MKKTLPELIGDLLHQIEISNYWDGQQEKKGVDLMSMEHPLKMNAAYLALKEFIASEAEAVPDRDPFEDVIRGYQESLAEYHFVAAAYKELGAAYDAVKRQLKDNPFQVSWIKRRDELEHDIKQIEPIMKELGYNILDELGGKYQLDLRFLKRPKANVAKLET